MRLFKFSIITLIISSVILATCAGIIVYVDPMFHYHKPIENLEYEIYDERYQNDGIMKNFDYDAIIIGTSMSENFKSSELNDLFNMHSIKVCFSGSTYNEINERLKTAFVYNKNIKMVVRGLDIWRLSENKDAMSYDHDMYPEYLYDSNLINDVQYLLSKEMLFKAHDVIEYTKSGKKTTNFDDYANWNDCYSFGKEAVLNEYIRKEKNDKEDVFTNDTYRKEHDNIMQNCVQIAIDNPNTDFYYFFTPVSICYFDSFNQNRELAKYIQKEKCATETMLQYDNIHLFSFFDDYDIILNLSNYKDYAHYGEWINSYILQAMKNNEHIITQENYKKYYDDMYKFYINYDYDSLFE